jgi:hypothetical protein
MTNNQNPSQEEPKGAVFDSIQGAKSRDPEVAEEPRQETKTTEPEPAKAPGEKATGDDGRLGKALQRAAQLERQINEIGPWAQFGMAVGNDPKGKPLVERYQKGDALFTEEDSEAVAEVEADRARRGEPPLTRQELADFMDQREAASRLASEINGMAEDELPEFRKIRRNPRYAELLDFYRQSVWQGRTPIDESVADWDNDYSAKEMTAVKRAYKAYLADNPKVLEAVKKAGEQQARDRAAEAAAVPSSETTTASSQEEPGDKTEADESIERMLKARGRGKSFASIGAKR